MKCTKVPFVMPQNPQNVDEVSGSLADFYKALGWDPKESTLDVRKIHISEKDYKDMKDMYMAVEGEKESIPMFLVNYMPSIKNGLEGIVVIEQGAF